jgi:hypothetical protein
MWSLDCWPRGSGQDKSSSSNPVLSFPTAVTGAEWLEAANSSTQMYTHCARLSRWPTPRTDYMIGC